MSSYIDRYDTYRENTNLEGVGREGGGGGVGGSSDGGKGRGLVVHCWNLFCDDQTCHVERSSWYMVFLST